MTLSQTTRRLIIPTLISATVFFGLFAFAYAEDTGEWFNIKNILWTFVVNVFGWLVAAAGSLLDHAIQNYIIGFADLFLDASPTGGSIGGAVDIAWVTVRDIFNLTFIFGLIWIGFKMILNSDDSNTRRWLVYLIMAAMLVNFSLFITKFIVDMSNMLATQIAINGFPDVDSDGDPDIALTYLERFGISSALDDDAWMSRKFSDSSAGGNDYMYIFGTAIVFLIAAFVFFAGALMIFIRFAALAIYMIFSPLMFLGWVFPSMSGITSKYWSGFLGRAFFAPAYILLVYFAALVVASYQNDANFAGAFGGAGDVVETSLMTTIIPFLMSTIFLIAAIVVANKMGADGASATIRVGNNLRGRIQRTVVRGAGGASAGMAARGLRNTAGRAAYAYSESEYGKRRAATSYLGRQAYKASTAVAGSSFDARRVGGVGKATGLGEGVKGGYAKSIKDRNEAEEKFVKSIAADFDANDPKTKAELAERAKEIEAEKTAEAKKLEAQAKYLEQDKDKSTAALQSEINDLEAIVREKQKKYDSGKANGTMTAGDLKKLAEEIAMDQRQADTKRSVLGNSQAKDSIKSEKQKLEQAAAAGDVSARQKIEDYDKQLAELDKEYSVMTNTMKNKAEDVRKQAMASAKFAEAEMKYANEIAYMDQLKRSEQFWDNWRTRMSSGAAAYVAGAAATGSAGISAGATLLATTGAGAAAARAQASRKNLERIYGKDGMKAADKEAKKKNAERFMQAANQDPASTPDANAGGAAGGDNNQA